eukprot:1589023-Pyramimonas_sp.AAC.1
MKGHRAPPQRSADPMRRVRNPSQLYPRLSPHITQSLAILAGARPDPPCDRQPPPRDFSPKIDQRPPPRPPLRPDTPLLMGS